LLRYLWFLKLVSGFDNVDDYIVDYNPYFGATVGRVANRIANSTFQIDGVTFNLTKNRGEHHLHGGIKAKKSIIIVTVKMHKFLSSFKKLLDNNFDC